MWFLNLENLLCQFLFIINHTADPHNNRDIYVYYVYRITITCPSTNGMRRTVRNPGVCLPELRAPLAHCPHGARFTQWMKKISWCREITRGTAANPWPGPWALVIRRSLPAPGELRSLNVQLSLFIDELRRKNIVNNVL